MSIQDAVEDDRTELKWKLNLERDREKSITIAR